MSKKSNKFSPEVRERAVRMVREHRDEYPSLWAAIESIAPKIGCVPQTLNVKLVLTRFHGHKRALGFRTVRSSVPVRLSQKQGCPQVRSTRWVTRLRRRDFHFDFLLSVSDV
mgnify:CR=1 FL=1